MSSLKRSCLFAVGDGFQLHQLGGAPAANGASLQQRLVRLLDSGGALLQRQVSQGCSSRSGLVRAKPRMMTARVVTRGGGKASGFSAHHESMSTTDVIHRLQTPIAGDQAVGGFERRQGVDPLSADADTVAVTPSTHIWAVVGQS